MMEEQKIYAFDFDGTLTRRDTLIEFIRYVRGTKATVLGFLRYLPLLVLMKAGLVPNGKTKRIVFSYFFAGMEESVFDGWCRKFAAANMRLLRPGGMEKVRKVLAEGGKVLIVSASVDNWVRPFFEALTPAAGQEEGGDGGRLMIVGTRVAVENGCLTGRFATKNCYGKEKVRRICELFPVRNEYYLTAYGDSRGDMEMLDFADEGYYKHKF